MEKYKIIQGIGEDIWNEVKADLDSISYPFVYNINIRENERSVFLNIEVDLGGGFESGFQSTSLTAPVPIQFTTLASRLTENRNFRFAVHDEDFIDKVGKFFGMEDIKTGYPEFDKKLVVKTNDPEKVKELFANKETRDLFQSLGGFNLHIANYDHDDRHSSLELTIDRAVTDAAQLHKIYIAFVRVLEVFEYRVSIPEHHV